MDLNYKHNREFEVSEPLCVLDDVKYTTPEYSREEVDAAGDTLIGEAPMPDDPAQAAQEEWAIAWEPWEEAYEVVNNWRASHSFPLNTFQTTLRTKARYIDPHCLLAQRLKRFPAILRKLRRKKLKLTEIQDIGGCRAVVNSVRLVDRLVQLYEKSDLKHELLRTDDYMRNPKVTGYRGVHLIYSYRSDRKSTYNGLKIELQFRSLLQHAWATAVETAEIFTGQALKSNQGNRKWKRFFALMGSAIALREKMPLIPNTPGDPAQLVSDVRRYVDALGVINHLRAFSFALKETEQDTEGAHFFLLRLEQSKQRILVTGYKATDLKQAQEHYEQSEREMANIPGDDVVLVSTESMVALRRAYPNYFADTDTFIAAVEFALGHQSSGTN